MKIMAKDETNEDVNVVDLGEKWDLKAEAHNNMINYLESKGLKENELLEFLELLREYSKGTTALGLVQMIDIKYS